MVDSFLKMKELYDMLEDDKSKQVFLARMLVDFDRSKENIEKLSSNLYVAPYGHRFNLSELDLDIIHELMATVQEIIRHNSKGDKVVIYGTAAWGKALAIRLYDFGCDFYGFIDRDYDRYANGVYQKKVYSPDWLINNKEEVYVAIAASNVYGSFDAIKAFLVENNFEEKRIIPTLHKLNNSVNYNGECHQQYFEFMNFFKKGTAYLDCGGYDGYTSIEFAKYCNRDYSKIYIFEPDSENAVMCEQAMKSNHVYDYEVIQMGCSDEESEVLFEAGLQGMSRFTSDSNENTIGTRTEKVKTIQIDKVVGETEVGFIKMDIEGAEMGALVGAKRTIMRDKPLLAICTYHKPGDTSKFLEFLHELVPEYHFWLRHYAEDSSETVLYASIKCEE